jgi:hypothetical protein
MNSNTLYAKQAGYEPELRNGFESDDDDDGVVAVEDE